MTTASVPKVFVLNKSCCSDTTTWDNVVVKKSGHNRKVIFFWDKIGGITCLLALSANHKLQLCLKSSQNSISAKVAEQFRHGQRNVGNGCEPTLLMMMGEALIPWPLNQTFSEGTADRALKCVGSLHD